MRSYVAITLLSATLAPEAITALVGTEPDVSLAAAGSDNLNRWELRSDADEGAELSEHVASAIERVRPYAERLRAGRTALDRCLLDVGIYLDLADSIPAIALSQEQLSFLAKLGVSLDVHVFLPGEAELSFDERPHSL